MPKAKSATPTRRARLRTRFAPDRFAPSCHQLESREVPAVVASFIAGTGILTVTGDEGDNTIEVSRDAAGNILVNGGEVAIAGGPATVTTTLGITIKGADGNDTLSLNETNGAMPATIFHGGAGNDSMTGGSAKDIFFGGDGRDTAVGRKGNDVAFLGNGRDVFVWSPGEGNDTIEGEAGVDEMVFNGAAADETVQISAVGGRVQFFRNPGNVTMDTDDVELITFNALGGVDDVTVNDLTGTDVTDVNINLGTAIGNTAGDGKADSVTVNGTGGEDRIFVNSTPAGIVVSGLQARVNITGSEAPNDDLFIMSLGGDDRIRAQGLVAGLIQFAANAGDGNDRVTGSQGNDVLALGAGDDTADGQAGDDSIDGGAGTDTLDGGPGTDTLTNGETVLNP